MFIRIRFIDEGIEYLTAEVDSYLVAVVNPSLDCFFLPLSCREFLFKVINNSGVSGCSPAEIFGLVQAAFD